MEKVPLSAAGFDKIESELKQLKSIERPAIIKAISEAREHGDLSENAEYHSAREKQSFIEGRIIELEDMVSRAEIIDISSLKGDTVKFGATVTIADEDTDEEKTYQILGEAEADLKKGKISISSPIARALIGKSLHSSVEVNTPKGVKYYELVRIEYS